MSSTICVDHRLRSPWPLYVEDDAGRPHEVSIEPGEMVFSEGARLTHGRPYALDGEYYANISCTTPQWTGTSTARPARWRSQANSPVVAK